MQNRRATGASSQFISRVEGNRVQAADFTAQGSKLTSKSPLLTKKKASEAQPIKSPTADAAVRQSQPHSRKSTQAFIGVEDQSQLPPPGAWK